MKYTSLLASSAALAALAIVVPVATPASWNLIPPAQADTDISFSLFYGGLGSHGHWVHHDDAYVFIPVNVRRGWRPYTDGHWVYARGYGWTWVSDEPFGWATYHYGRWGYSQRIGWYWVPGTRWAPAWVSWRRSGDHVAWAPLPPRRGRGGGDSDVSIFINFDTVPDYYWNVVPTQSFLSINIETVIIRDNDRRRRIVRESEFVGNVKVENNIIVNNAIEVNYIEEKSGKKVKEVEVKKTDDPNQAKSGDGEVTAFTGEVKAEGDAKPEKVTKVEEIKTEEVATEAGVDAGAQTEVDADAQTGKKAKKSGDVATETEAGTEAQTEVDAEAQTGKKAKKSGDVATETEAGTEVQTETETEAEAQTGKDKKKASADAEVEAETDANVNAEAQTGKKKKASADANAEVEADAEAEAQVQTGTKKKQVEETEALSAEDEAAQSGKKKKKASEEEEVVEPTN